MKINRVTPVIFLFGFAALLLSGCRSSATPVPAGQTVTIQRGNLTSAISATGNLTISHTQNLAFQTDGTVTDVFVELGDSVKQGQTIAQLDTSAWQNQLTTLQDTLTSKQRALTIAQYQVQAKQDALTQAQMNLQTAQYNLNVINDVKAANDRLTNAQQRLANDMENYLAATSSGITVDFWSSQIASDNAAIKAAQQELNNVLSGHSTTLSPDVSTDIAIKSLAVQAAQGAVTEAQNTIVEAQNAVIDAQTAVNEAQKTLDNWKNTNPVLTAPFDGFISLINVAQGDQIYKGKIAAQVSDPNQFEADVLVSERDVFNVKLNGDATVQMDALPGITLPAKVNKVSETATINSGVVNYTVTVAIQSLEPVSGTARLTPGASSGTQGQQNPAATSSSTPSASAASRPSSSASVAAVQPKAGLTANVNIIIAQRNNVLMVPSIAIIRQQGGSYVDVLKNGTTQQQAVQTGISNTIYTEITGGLTEGESVVIPQASASTSGPSFFPGGRGLLR